MTEYDKIVLLAISPMLIAIMIGMIWDVLDWIKQKINSHKNQGL